MSNLSFCILILQQEKNRMPNNRGFQLWVVNLVSSALLLVLMITGLANAFLLPRGYETKAGGLSGLRHFLCDVHLYTAVIFIAVMLIHLLLHRSYISACLKKYGLSGKNPEDVRKER